ncbi:replication initiator [Nocardia sp. NPDC051570]|uniref:replication initiator n=1 Tax=Nocardia sp. NPDC051570 TaxID=3364324 RepID=UPI003791D409
MTEIGDTGVPGKDPFFDDVVVTTALRYRVCIRPVVLERRDTVTGARELVTVPCGHTQESKCPPCAKKAKALRLAQCREGWHAEREPEIPKARPTFDQTGLMCYRADLVAALATAHRDGDTAEQAELREEIAWTDKQLTELGMWGKPPAADPADDASDPGASGSEIEASDGARRRSTRRREDAADLPRLPISDRTIGRQYAGRFRPSMMVTLTLPGYGRVCRDDGTPIDPDTYDYEAAAWDAIGFSRLFSRWVQTLRRATGVRLQYFAAVEPQRRGAPHVHLAIRGAIPHRIIRQITAATYHQMWWPQPGAHVYDDDRLPVFDRDAKTFVDPSTRAPLQGWDEAIEATFAEDAQPAHTVRFGVQVDSKGILAGTPAADRSIGYLAKYLTKSVDEILEPRSARQADHYDRLHETLCRTPCSERCAVWLLHGIVPKGAGARTQPGRCKGRAHRRETLGLPGRRVLTSERWTGKTLGDHKADRMEFVRRTLAAAGIDKPAPDPRRYTWSTLAPGTRVPSRARLLLAAIAERIGWQAEYDRALPAVEPPPGARGANSSAIRSTGDGQDGPVT